MSTPRKNTPTRLDTAYEVLKEANRSLHVGEITNISLQNGRLKTNGKAPAHTLNTKILEDIEKNGEDSRFKRIKPAVYATNDNYKKSPIHKKQNTITNSDTIEPKRDDLKSNRYVGIAGEHLVCAELLFQGFRAGRAEPDDGIDIDVHKNGFHFGLQVKTRTCNKSGVFVFDIPYASFARYEKRDIFYVFVLREKDHNNRFLIFPYSKIKEMLTRGIMVKIGKERSYRAHIRIESKQIHIGNKEEELSYYRDNWSQLQ